LYYKFLLFFGHKVLITYTGIFPHQRTYIGKIRGCGLEKGGGGGDDFLRAKRLEGKRGIYISQRKDGI
jgi:hypothetical protein